MKQLFPLIIWPFIKPTSAEHCKRLIEYLADANDTRLAIPTIVINHRSKEWIKGPHLSNIQRMEKLKWKIRWVWSVDTCQMWLDALGSSQQSLYYSPSDPENILSQPNPHQSGKYIHMLIPSDFHYASQAGENALSRIIQQFDKMIAPEFQLSLGQLNTQSSDFKGLVDSVGTWRLLGLWFPKEEAVLRQITTKPCSEFLAFSDEFLVGTLKERWLPYAQTLIILLKQIRLNTIHQVNVYDLGRLEEDPPTNPFKEIITQIERTERALKLYWRDSQTAKPEIWSQEYIELMRQSGQLMQEIVSDLHSKLLP